MWVGGQSHAPAALFPGIPGTLRIGGWVGPQDLSGRVRKISGFDPRTVQADYAIPVHNVYVCVCVCVYIHKMYIQSHICSMCVCVSACIHCAHVCQKITLFFFRSVYFPLPWSLFLNFSS
jgi:hypothetical protein